MEYITVAKSSQTVIPRVIYAELLIFLAFTAVFFDLLRHNFTE